MVLPSLSAILTPPEAMKHNHGSDIYTQQVVLRDAASIHIHFQKINCMVLYSKYSVYRQSIHMKHSLLCPLTLRVTLKQPPFYLKQWKSSLMLNTLSSIKSVAQQTLPTCQVVKQVLNLVHTGPTPKLQ